MTSRHPYPYLTIEATSTPEAHTIALNGEVDLLGAPKIEAALKDAPLEPKLVIVDLSDLTFIDSSGLHALATGQKLCQVRGQQLKIIPGPANVQRLFELTGMREVLPFCDADVAHEPQPGEDSAGSTEQ